MLCSCVCSVIPMDEKYHSAQRASLDHVDALVLTLVLAFGDSWRLVGGWSLELETDKTAFTFWVVFA